MLRFSRRLQEHYGRFEGPHNVNEGGGVLNSASA